MNSAAEWSDELDAVRFPVPDHGALCAVHRLAFKALLNVPPDRVACLLFFEQNKEAFVTAAKRKIERLKLQPGRSLHLNSRDIRRCMTSASAEGPSRACRVLDR